MAILCEQWRKQPLTPSDSVIKRMLLEKCFLVWKAAPSKAQSHAFVFAACGSLLLAKVSLNQQILWLCWDHQEITSCIFWIQPQCYVSTPTLVLVLCFLLLTDSCRAGWKETSDSSDPNASSESLKAQVSWPSIPLFSSVVVPAKEREQL